MVSVIIPTYNRDNTIKKAVESVLNQTYNDVEVIVVDDGSTDNTAEVINSISDNRVKYIQLEHKNGNHARNVGIKEEKGDCIALLDSDDYWKPEKLDKQICALKKYGADVCFCGIERYNTETNQCVESIQKSFVDGIVSYDSIVSDAIFPFTILAKRQVFIENLFDEDLKRMQGYDWQIRAGVDNVFCYINEALAISYILSDSITMGGVNKLFDAADYILKKTKGTVLEKNPQIESYLTKILIGCKVSMGQHAKEDARKLYKIDKSPKNFLRLLLMYFGLYRCSEKIVDKISGFLKHGK